MRRLALSTVLASAAFLALGCSANTTTTMFDDGTGQTGGGTAMADASGGGTTGADTTGGGTTGGATTGGGTGGGTGVSVPDPTAEKVCADPLNEAPSPYVGYPFTGLSYTPDTPKSSGATYNFTCTRCPGGTLGISGKYKYFEGEDVTSPDPAEWKETWEFEGNRFVNIIEGIDTDGQLKKVRAEGFYFCPDPAELQNMKYLEWWNTVLVYLDVNPAGPFGLVPGAVDLSFLGVDAASGAAKIFADTNLFWDPKGTSQAQNQYCRIGSTSGGRECKDPFAQ